jgi:exopolysaccharide biosynthesis operon protein EpsL
MSEKDLVKGKDRRRIAVYLSQSHRVTCRPGNSVLGMLDRLLSVSSIQIITLFCLLQLLGMGHSFADDQDIFNLEAGVQQAIDNNLFRLPAAVDPYTLGLSGHERSDSITTTSLGVLYNQPIGMQKLHIEAVESDNRYQNYGYLGGTTTYYNASWQLAVTRALTGMLSTNKTQSIANFAYYNAYTVRDLITNDSTDLNLDWSLSGSDWHMTADLADRDYLNSENNTQVASTNYKFLEGGIKYVFPSGSSIGVFLDKSVGSYKGQVLDVVNQLDTGFNEKQEKVVLVWPITGKSLVNAQIGNVNRQYDHFASRNYSGTTGNISYSYGALNNLAYIGPLPGGLIELPQNMGLIVSAARTYNPFTDINESYYVNTKRTVQANWMPTFKLNIKLRFDSYTNDFRDPIPGVTVLVPRIDNGNTYTLEADWALTRTIVVVGTAIRDQRGSTALVGSTDCIVGCGYNDISGSLSINAKF